MTVFWWFFTTNRVTCWADHLASGVRGPRRGTEAGRTPLRSSTSSDRMARRCASSKRSGRHSGLRSAIWLTMSSSALPADADLLQQASPGLRVVLAEDPQGGQPLGQLVEDEAARRAPRRPRGGAGAGVLGTSRHRLTTLARPRAAPGGASMGHGHVHHRVPAGLPGHLLALGHRRCRRARSTEVDAAPGNPLTQGYICHKVKHHARRVYAPERIRTPLVRAGPKGEGRFREASWDEALDLVAERVREADRARRRPGQRPALPLQLVGRRRWRPRR